ncbi:MAG: right-handed parallel beta-helix repeat-containing protein [Clostridia bacterium]|nr:right-handed parallel beta-helix repeat-containing protein [Clostridia bacterium]
MAKLWICVLCLMICVVSFVSCNGGDISKTPETTVYDYERIPDVIEPHEERVITAEELGYQAVAATTEKYWVARASVAQSGDVTITSLNPGTTVITVKNNYAEAVEMTVTVALDYSIESIRYEKFEMPGSYVYADDFGMSPSLVDNAPQLQAAIDAVAEKGGGTVYVPKGIYATGIVVIKDNVTIRLEGVIEDYNAPLSASDAADVSSENGPFAVLKAIPGQVGIFINHQPQTRGALGFDNFAFYGGVLDMNGSVRALIWVCAENVTLENVILKDCPNDHAIQITGSKNVTVRNCLFAGYNDGPVFTRETIQIEATTPAAIGGTTSIFEEYEYYHCENVVIESCYFGSSDKYGFHQIPIGHHGHTQKSSVEGLVIKGCSFDNPRIVALRLYGFSDVEILNNRFFSNQAVAVDGDGRFMIEITFETGAVQLPDDGPYLATRYSRKACDNIAIHDNEFEIGSLSQMGGIVKTLAATYIIYDARAEVELPCRDFYTDPTYMFTGYKMVGNHVSDLRITNNSVSVQNDMGGELFYLCDVKGLVISGNEVDAPLRDLEASNINGEECIGVYLRGCKLMDKWSTSFVVSATAANGSVPLVLRGTEGEIHVFCNAEAASKYYDFTLFCTEGGKIDRWGEDDGRLIVDPIAEEGYVFDGFYVDNVRIEGDRFEFAAATRVEVRFTAES